MAGIGTGRRARLPAVLMAAALALAGGAAVVGISGAAGPVVERVLPRLAVAAGAAALPEGAALTLLERYFPARSAALPQSPPVSQPELSAPAEAPSAAEPALEPPEIDPRYRGVLLSETMLGTESAVCWPIGAGYLRNYTDIPRATLDAALSQPLSLTPKADGRVEVLIMHTHATESYEAYDAAVYDTRNTDNNENMVAVGDALADALTAAGIGVVHDTQQFDYPSYNGSYDRAAEVIRQYQARYPDLQLILDVHRDGIQRDASTIVKPVTEIDGEAAAQIMILCGSDSSIPDWGENLRTAAAVTNLLETRYPSLMRPIFFSTGRYNMDLSGHLLLLEFGSQANTLEEALTSARLTGAALADWLKELAARQTPTPIPTQRGACR